MKKQQIALLISAIALSSCTNSTKKSKEIIAAQEVEIETQVIPIDTLHSTILWKGGNSKESHNGTITLKGGTISVKGDTVTEGKFIIDMTTIENTSITNQKMRTSLVSHLKSADFFDIQLFPEAFFNITHTHWIDDDKTMLYIEGNLEIKGVSHLIKFLSYISKEGPNYTATSDPILIDRTKWGINHGSKSVYKDLKDNLVNDTVEIQLEIQTL